MENVLNFLVETGNEDFLFEFAMMVIATVSSVLGYYGKKYITDKMENTKYDAYREKSERILENAIAYAEAKAKEAVKNKLDSINKKEMAKEYINKVSPDIVSIEGDKLDLMIDRKVIQVEKK